MSDLTKSLLSVEDLILLDEQNSTTLALWWCQLNMSRWPKQIPNPDPLDGFYANRMWAFMDEILFRIGWKECMRAWNNEKMSREEFEKWWGAIERDKA